MSCVGKKLPSRCGSSEVTASSFKATTCTRMLRRLSMGKNSASSSIRWAELPWASWPSRSRMAVRLSSMPFKAGSSQSYRPETSSIVVSVFTDSGSSIGYATRLAQRSRRVIQKLGDLVADVSLSAVVDSVYALEQFKEAFDQSLKSNRGGKILFKFVATH